MSTLYLCVSRAYICLYTNVCEHPVSVCVCVRTGLDVCVCVCVRGGEEKRGGRERR